MSKIISIHSFRGGTGKSNTTANLAALMAMQGKRIGVVDTDIQSPGIHVLFGLDDSTMGHSLNDYLWGKCTIIDTAHDVTNSLKTDIPGKIYLIPSSIQAGEIARVIHEGYDAGLLNDGFSELLDKMNLDALLIDTHPGINEETLLSIAISDILLVIMRPDKQDYQGTSVTVDVARKMGVPSLFMILNKVPSLLDRTALKKMVEDEYEAEVVAVIPHSDEMMTLASEGIFSIRYPNHPIVVDLKQVAQKLLA
ncbi:MAG: MinD/ParA family protein [Anaerolineales bacterium]|nr:MinD/ParA family protein [Anaerolineales bacterium]